ncbi:HAD-like domain-containing protein [Aspergillus insuetus]
MGSENLYRERLAAVTWVAFDLDDTLHEFQRASAAASKAVFAAISQRYGIFTTRLQDQYTVILREKTLHAFSDGRLSHEYRRERFLALLGSFEIAIDDDFVQKLLTLYESSLASSLKLKDGALSLLQRLKHLGKKIAVITEGPQDAQAWTITQLGIETYVDYLATTNQFRVSKTSGLIPQVLEHLGIKPNEIVHIEDSMERDIVPASKEGILCIHLADKQGGMTDDGVFQVSELAKVERLLLQDEGVV